MKLKILDLFSGLGGFSLGLERTGSFETIAFCDNDKYSKLVLQKHWKGVKIYNDVKEITKEKLITKGILTLRILRECSVLVGFLFLKSITNYSKLKRKKENTI